MLTQKSAIERVKRFATEIVGLGIPLNRVILFGSYSKNSQNQWSDIDVALVSDKFSGIGFFDSDLIGGIKIQKSYSNIQTRTYNTRNFNPGKDTFVEEILKTGIEIV